VRECGTLDGVNRNIVSQSNYVRCDFGEECFVSYSCGCVPLILFVIAAQALFLDRSRFLLPKIKRECTDKKRVDANH
jgi:hypothetical protein